MCSQEQLLGSKGNRVEQREKTNQDAVATVASVNHSKSSKTWKSSKGVFIAAKSMGFSTAQ